MSKTVILLNPMGTDVTNYVNHTAGVAQLMNGSIAAPGDTIYTLPYTNQSGVSNVSAGVSMLDTKLKATTGQVLVFGYSEGCQIADWWLTNQGSTPATGVSPSNVSFLLIGNANRKYGGFAYGHSVFNSAGYTAGKPDNTPYTVIDFARQYDPICDFPTAAPIVNALVGLSTVGADNNVYTGAMQSVATVMASTPYSTAVSNVVVGLAMVHTGLGVAGTGYMSVTVSDPVNLSLPDGNITWVWSPTYPVPLLGVGGTFPQSDLQLRTVIEQAYSRPVTIPMPNYGNSTGWGVEPFPLPVSPPPVTGWWAELHVSCHITVTPHVTTAPGHHANAAITVTPSMSAVAAAMHYFTVAKTVTPTVTVYAAVKWSRTAATVVTPSVTAMVTLIKRATVSLTVAPSVSSVARERDGATIAVTPTVTAAGRVTRFASVSKTVTPTVTVTAVVTRFVAVAKTVTSSVTPVGGVTRFASAAKTVTPSITSTARASAVVSVTVTPTVTATAVVIRSAVVAKTITPTVTPAGRVTRFANVAITVTPSVSSVARERDGASVIVTPSVTPVAHAIKSISVAITVTPTVSGGDKARAAVAKTVTPTMSATGAVTRFAAVSKTITPTVTAAAVVIKVGAVANTITPSITVVMVMIRKPQNLSNTVPIIRASTR